MNSDLLVYQAKSFYNAYINLEAISQGPDYMMFIVPVLVNGAFSIELTLKAILTKNDISYEKEHNLWMLFILLPEELQHEIKENLQEKAPEYSDSKKWEEEFILTSNVFADWRYCFEGKSTPAVDSRFISALANAAITTMFHYYNVDLVPAIVDRPASEISDMFSKNRAECKSQNIKYIDNKKKRHNP